MARGTRTPSPNAYRGALGRTQTTTVHVTGPRGDLIAAQVYTTVDAASDPELVERLHTDDPVMALNVVRAESGESIRVAVPVVYHDPVAELLVLVLSDSHRHRELDERIALLQRMRTDDAAIPQYAKEFSVVYGAAGLRVLLEKRANDALEKARHGDASNELDRRRAELDGRATEIEKTREGNEKRARELERRALDLDTKSNAIERARAELEKARGEIDRLRSEARKTMIAAAAAQAAAQAAQDAAKTTIARAPAAPAPLAPPESDDEIQPDRTTIGMAPTAEEPMAKPIASGPHGFGAMPPVTGNTEPTPLPLPMPGLLLDGLETKPVPLDELDEIETSLANVALEEQRIRASSENLLAGESGFEDAIITGVETPTPAATNGHAPSSPLDVEEEITGGASIVPAGADPLTTETHELADVASDGWLDKAAGRDTSSITVGPDGVRLALVAGEQLSRGLGGKLDIRVLLHRTSHYPVIALVIGPPAAMRVPSTTQLATVTLDIALDTHRAVLAVLAKKFELTIELVVRGRRIRRTKLVAPLAENVGYIVRAAEDHLRGLSSGGLGDGAPSFDRARDLVTGAGFDLLGIEHSDANEFRDDKLAQLDSAQSLRRAIAMARRFARPIREDYLVCTRGFPLSRWRELRRHVLESAVQWGLWMGPELAQVAVSEGLARSRRDLVVRLDHGFEKLKRHTTAFDIDAEATADNAKALAEEARALGVELTKKDTIPPPAQAKVTDTSATQLPRTNGSPVTSDEAPAVSGSIGGTPPKGSTRPKASVEELLAMLDDREKRVSAAIELCERCETKAAVQVIAAVAKMSRAEAVRVLGMSVKFGEAAAAPLIQGLQSSKGFLRHGCALALALLRTEDGTQAVIDLLLNEPTEIWREVARAIGQVGPTGLMPLASNFGRLGDRATPQAAERVAWAMAHIAVRGGKAAIEMMANGQSAVAPVARHALQLHASAANDHVRVRPGAAEGSQAGRDVTVNRAFSRRFFEALEQGLPDAAQAGLEALDASSPMELLDEADLIEEDDEGEQLDESDLIQT
ncbi:MAG: hypothetical protein ACKV2T_14395 [Kofleriaceae bacterium]